MIRTESIATFVRLYVPAADRASAMRYLDSLIATMEIRAEIAEHSRHMEHDKRGAAAK